MTPLPTTFRRDQFGFKQVFNTHPVYIYRKTKGDWEGYEVIIARQRPGCTINGRVIEPRWGYPGSEEWGAYGWSCQTLERAHQKVAELAKEQK